MVVGIKIGGDLALRSRPNLGRKFNRSNSGGHSLWAGWPGRVGCSGVGWLQWCGRACGSEFSVRTGGRTEGGTTGRTSTEGQEIYCAR